ncbi:MAG: hypothetical protein RLW61_09690 [Gammaproteobacteria bacterium]
MSLARQPFAILLMLAALPLVATAVPVTSSVNFDEGVAGDLSNLTAAPTLLGTFAAGLHTVSGTLGTSDYNDVFTFDVEGLLEAVTLESRSGDGNTFIGLYAQAFAPPGGQVGDGFFAAGEVGASPFNTKDPFAGGALPGGDFTVALTNLQGVGYTLSFSVAPVPLPAAWIGLLPAALALARYRRRA